MIWGWRGNQNDESGILNLSFYSDAVEVPLESFEQAHKLANAVHRHMSEEMRMARKNIIDDIQHRIELLR